MNFGNAGKYFWKNCANLYQERKKWFSRVHKLAGDPSEPTALPIFKASLQQTSFPNKKILENQTVAFPSVKVVPQISLEDTHHERIPSSTAEVPSSKPPKKKTQGIPDKNKRPLQEKSKKPSPDVKKTLNSMSERDRLRRKRLQQIQAIRLSKSAKKNDIESMRDKAILFVNGKLLHEGKIKISWQRGILERKVTFETSHKQPLEKPSVYKGFKLTKALDALEQIYLDGWDEKNILAHLHGRYSLYNLPSEFLSILWKSPEVKMKKK